VLGFGTYGSTANPVAAVASSPPVVWLPNRAVPALTVAAGTKVLLVGHVRAQLQTTSSWAAVLYQACYRSSTSTAPTVFGIGSWIAFDNVGSASPLVGPEVPVDGIVSFSAAGTYEFGICGQWQGGTAAGADNFYLSIQTLAFQ
jgi:hypothetical protein